MIGVIGKFTSFNYFFDGEQGNKIMLSVHEAYSVTQWIVMLSIVYKNVIEKEKKV